MKRWLSYLAALALFVGTSINVAVFAAEGEEEEIIELQLGEAPELEKALKELEQLQSIHQALAEKIKDLKGSKELEDQSLSSLANKFAVEFKKSEAQYKTTGKASNELINAAASFITKLSDILEIKGDTATQRANNSKEINNAMTQLENALAPFAYAKLAEFMTVPFPTESIKPFNIAVLSLLEAHDELFRHLLSHYVTGKTMGATRARPISERLWPVRSEFDPKETIEIQDKAGNTYTVSLLDLAESTKIKVAAEEYPADIKKSMQTSLDNIIKFLQRLGVKRTDDGLKLIKKAQEKAAE